LKVCSRILLPVSLFAAGLSCGCVSVREHTQVRDQLRVEQRKAIERERRVRDLEILAGRLRKKTTVAELERAQAHARLAAAEKLLVLKPPPGHMPRETAAPTPDSRDGVLAGTIRFAAGGDRLSEADVTRIAEIAALLAERKDVRVRVEGHSDPAPIGHTQGMYRTNMHLSTLRALAVYHELVRHEGVNPSRIAIVGCGEYRPVPGGPETLRRVEIRLLPEGGGPASASSPDR